MTINPNITTLMQYAHGQTVSSAVRERERKYHSRKEHTEFGLTVKKRSRIKETNTEYSRLYVILATVYVLTT